MAREELYDSIFTTAAARLRRGDIALDEHLLDPEHDTRLGISIVIPLGIGRGKYERLVDDFKRVAPAQYFYPHDDLHVTVFDFTIAVPAYVRSPEKERLFVAVADDAVRGFHRFVIRFEGIVFSEAAGIICGYDLDALCEMRTRLRRAMNTRGLPVEERYASRSSHATFCRFIAPLDEPDAFVSMVEGKR